LEIFPANSSPGNIVASTAPLYSYTTSQTILNYGITEPPLVIGREYVWRVHAHDLENRELFRNNGYSQLCTFHYGNNLDLLGNIGNITLHAQAITHRQAHCWWDSISVYSSYRLEFRKIGSQNWFPFITNHASLLIPDLEPNSDYEAHVTGITSENAEGPQSNTVTWHTPLQPILNCGETSPPPTQQNFHPLTQANTGMIWQVGQFEMQVTSLNGTANQMGWYSGLGKVVMPLGWTVNCSFSNVQIGEDHVMYSGEVRAITEGINQWVDQYNNTGNVAPEIEVNTEINNAGDIVVNELGEEITINGQTFEYDTADGTAISDANGSLWVVTNDGTVIYSGESGHVFNPAPPTAINTNYGTATFSASTNQLYGFDGFQIPAWRSYYDDVTDLKDNSVSAVSWKSVQAKKYDVISVVIQPLQGIPIDSIFFYTPSGTIYAAHGNGNTKTIYLVGGENKDRQDLYAGFYSSTHQIINIGKVNCVSFEKEEKKIWLVSLENSTNSSVSISQGKANQLQQSLDSIYAGGIIKWNVEIAPQPFIPSGWDSNNDNRIDVKSSELSRYSDEMNAINNQLHYQSYYSPDDYFIYVSAIPADSSGNNLEGEMPRGKNIGFVFESPNDPHFIRTVSHEIGHGAFALEHSFNGNAPAPKSMTDNLLDYNNGNRLVQFQWAWMHNPSGWTGLDDDGNGSAVYVDMRELLPFLNPDSSSFTFYSPAGLPFSLPKNGLSQVAFSYGDEYNLSSCVINGHYNENPVGALYSYVLDGKRYVCNSSCSSNQFISYHLANSTTLITDSISHSSSWGIVGYPCIEDGEIVFVLQKQNFQNLPTIPTSGYTSGGAIVQHILNPDFLALGNSPVTKIKADISPAYSSDAENYLFSNLEAAKCGSGQSSFVLTYAYQINKYPEVYNCCFKQEEITSETADPFTSYLPLPNAYTSISTTTPFEQQEQKVNLLQDKTRLQFYYIDHKRKNVNAELMAINDDVVMADSLFSTMHYTCVWNVLTVTTRLHAIHVLSQSMSTAKWLLTSDDGYGSLVTSLLGSANDKSQQDSILIALRENNNELLQLLWSKLNFDDLDEFVNTITGWLASSATNKPTFSSLHDDAYIGNPINSQATRKYFEFYNWADDYSMETYRFSSENHWIAGSDNVYIETYFDPSRSDAEPGGELFTDLDAFDWIAIHIGDDIPGLGLKEGRDLVVPMIWAKWLSTRIRTEDQLKCVNLFKTVIEFLAIDYAATTIFGAIFTGTAIGTELQAIMVGQEIRASVVFEGVDAQIATTELGADGEWIFKDVKWIGSVESGYLRIGNLASVKYLNEEGILTQGFLEVVYNEATRLTRVKVAAKIEFATSWLPNRTIQGNLENPVGILGCFNKTNIPGYGTVADTKQLLEQLHYPKTNDFSFSLGGFKLLNSVEGTFINLDQFWVEYNEPFLKTLTDAKTDIYVLSDPENEYLLYQTELDANNMRHFTLDPTTNQRILTSFGREMRYMNNLVSQGKYIWDSVNGVFKSI
jgi:hypothetical protein